MLYYKQAISNVNRLRIFYPVKNAGMNLQSCGEPGHFRTIKNPPNLLADLEEMSRGDGIRTHGLLVPKNKVDVRWYPGIAMRDCFYRNSIG